MTRWAALALAAFAGASEAGAQAPQPSFFNSREVRSANLQPFTKWNHMLARYAKEYADAEGSKCEPKKVIACNYAEWKKFLESLKGKDKPTQVAEVNARMNGAKYIVDESNWGEKDYWASPGEFMAKFGDCEDYAIIKYLSLKALGFPERELRVVAVEDLNLKVGHAILVVFLDGKTLVLDNQIKSVLEAAKIRHYKPVFSINKDFWWRHL
jgi:predicted transglutaminase-like cysteine proteinase